MTHLVLQLLKIIAHLQKRSKTLPFVASVQHVRNANLMVMCKECDMWRLLYSPHKISAPERQKLSAALDDYSFTCAASLSALNLDGMLSEVCVRELKCYDLVEKLYYSMKYEPICIYCCGNENFVEKELCYRQCRKCEKQPPIRKRV